MASRLLNKGLKSLRRKFRRTIPQKVKLATRGALAKGADEIVAMAKSLVPVSPGGGGLRDSIGWTFGDAPVGSLVLGRFGGDKDALRVTIYVGDKENFQARFIEFGTNPHNTAKGGGGKLGRAIHSLGGGARHPGSAPRPFFFVSYRFLRKRVRARITRVMNKAIKEAVR